MVDVLSAINMRISVRKFTNELISKEDLSVILKCGVRAPTGLNKQPLGFVVIRDRAFLNQANVKAKLLYREAAEKNGVELPGTLERLISAPDTDIFYGSTNVLFVYASADAATPVADGFLAIENIFLSSMEFGIGSCVIGLASELGEDKEFRAECDIPDDSTFVAAIALGYPAQPAEIHTRNPPKILKLIE